MLIIFQKVLKRSNLLLKCQILLKIAKKSAEFKNNLATFSEKGGSNNSEKLRNLAPKLLSWQHWSEYQNILQLWVVNKKSEMTILTSRFQ